MIETDRSVDQDRSIDFRSIDRDIHARSRSFRLDQSIGFRTAEDKPKPELTGMRLRLTTRSGGIGGSLAYSNARSQANARTSARCDGDVYVWSLRMMRERGRRE